MSLAITLLGATGSVGSSVLGVIAENTSLFRVEAVVGGTNAIALAQVARQVNASFAALADPDGHAELVRALSGSGIACGAGRSAVLEAASRPTGLCVAGITGTAGMAPVLAAIDLGYPVALANKEVLVTAGALVMRRAREKRARILPLDSEHNALLQALGDQPVSDVACMTITASGGPFRDWSAADIENAPPKNALAHPNWQMGAKISIDSATLMNKGLELIEAQHLFGLVPEQLDVVVHRQSIIHGLIQFIDGSVTAGLAIADMRIPAAHCLGQSLQPPQRLLAPQRALNLLDKPSWTFEAPDRSRFPCLALAEAAMRAGGDMPAVLNAANEIAVEAYLAGRLHFGGIPALVDRVCTRLSARKSLVSDSLEAVLAVDQDARECAREMLTSASVN
jgi:1-deoxy-D-xylulose-5-phosphate reductoisomerase